MYLVETATYPVVGVGAFFVFFWVEFVLGDLLGLACNALLILGFLLSTIGTYCVARADTLRAATEESG